MNLTSLGLYDYLIRQPLQTFADFSHGRKRRGRDYCAGRKGRVQWNGEKGGYSGIFLSLVSCKMVLWVQYISGINYQIAQGT